MVFGARVANPYGHAAGSFPRQSAAVYWTLPFAHREFRILFQRLLVSVLLLLLPAAARADAPNFRFQDFPRGIGESLAAQSGIAYDHAAEWFGTDLERTVVVRWVSRREDMLRLGVRNPESVAGLARADSSLIVLYAPALGPRPERIRGVLLHEICHLFVAHVTRRAELEPPRWLNEGIAMWVSGEWDLGLELRSDHASLLQDAVAARALLPFEELDTGFPEGRFFHVAYAQSLSFIKWMIAQRGEDQLREYLRALDEDLDPEPAFRRIYGVGFGDAELAWRDELMGGGPLSGLPSSRTLLEFLWVSVALLMILKFVQVRLRLRNAPDDPEAPAAPGPPDAPERPGAGSAGHPPAPGRLSGPAGPPSGLPRPPDRSPPDSSAR